MIVIFGLNTIINLNGPKAKLKYVLAKIESL